MEHDGGARGLLGELGVGEYELREIQCGRAAFPGWPTAGPAGHCVADGMVGNAPVAFFLRGRHRRDRRPPGGAHPQISRRAGQLRVAFVVDVPRPGPGRDPRYLEIRGTAEALSDVEPP